MRLRDAAKEARGSALWDAAKWLFAAGGSVLIVLVQAIQGWVTGHPNLASLGISAGVVIFLGAVALIVHRYPPGVMQPKRTTPASDMELRAIENARTTFRSLPFAQQIAFKRISRQPGILSWDAKKEIVDMGFADVDKILGQLEATNLIHRDHHGRITPDLPMLKHLEAVFLETDNAPIVSSHVPDSITHSDAASRNAPQVLVRYSRTGLVEKLTFENDAQDAALNIEIGPLAWNQTQPLALDHAISAVRKDHPEECKMQPVEVRDGNTGTLTTLFDFMRNRTPVDAVTSVTLCYEDSQKTRFSRQFILTTFPDGTISWRPEPVRTCPTALR